MKRTTLCNCLCFSSSSCFSASVIRNIKKFEAKNYFNDHQTPNTIKGFINSFPILKIHDRYWDTQKFEQLFIPIKAISPSDTKRLQCIDVNNPLQTVFKRVNTVYTFSNCMINRLLYC